MYKLEKILFPTDFSANAENSLPFAKEITKRTDGVLSMFHSYEVPLMAPVSAFVSRDKTIASIGRETRALCEKKMTELGHNHKLQDVHYRTLLDEGDTIPSILKTIESEAKKLPPF